MEKEEEAPVGGRRGGAALQAQGEVALLRGAPSGDDEQQPRLLVSSAPGSGRGRAGEQVRRDNERRGKMEKN